MRYTLSGVPPWNSIFPASCDDVEAFFEYICMFQVRPHDVVCKRLIATCLLLFNIHRSRKNSRSQALFEFDTEFGVLDWPFWVTGSVRGTLSQCANREPQHLTNVQEWSVFNASCCPSSEHCYHQGLLRGNMFCSRIHESAANFSCYHITVFNRDM